MDRFYHLIEELEEKIGTELPIDHRNICAFIANERVPLQLEPDSTGERLLVCANICEIPAGKYREMLLKECLKHNGQLPPRYGTFAYVERTNKLALFEALPLKELTADKLLDYFEHFIPKALEWQEAIERGSPLPTVTAPRGPAFPHARGLYS